MVEEKIKKKEKIKQREEKLEKIEQKGVKFLSLISGFVTHFWFFHIRRINRGAKTRHKRRTNKGCNAEKNIYIKGGR